MGRFRIVEGKMYEYLDGHFSRYLDGSSNGNKITLPGVVAVVFEEGRTAAMQGQPIYECPYFADLEPEQLSAWRMGYRSVSIETSLSR